MEDKRITAVGVVQPGARTPTFLVKTTRPAHGQLPNIYVGVASTFSEARDLVEALEKTYGDLALELKMLDAQQAADLRASLQTLERLVEDTVPRLPILVGTVSPIDVWRKAYRERMALRNGAIDVVMLRTPGKRDRRQD